MTTENQQMIAKKSNFNLTSRITGIVVFAIFVIIPSKNDLFVILEYVAYAGIAFFFVLLILHLLEPNTKMSAGDGKLFIHRIHKIIAIDTKAIKQVRHIKKHIRGMEYTFGKIQILTQEKLFTIDHIEKVEEVHQSISQLLVKK